MIISHDDELAESPPPYVNRLVDVDDDSTPLLKKQPRSPLEVDSRAAAGSNHVVAPLFVNQPLVQSPMDYRFASPACNEMECLHSGVHDTETQWGPVGLLFAVIWFPIGIACCLLDRKVACKRCGTVLQRGLL